MARLILVCLDGDEQGQLVFAAAERLAIALHLRVGVLRILRNGREDLHPRVTPAAWTIQTVDPVVPVLNFMRLNRIRRVVLGPRAWAKWGKSLWDKGHRSGELLLCWTLPAGSGSLWK